ncbi:MAG: hypothetical protein ACJAZI_001212 [Cycloclasticus sp.]|jgi:hypothetical protein
MTLSLEKINLININWAAELLFKYFLTILKYSIGMASNLKLKTGVSSDPNADVAVKELYEAIYQPGINFAIFFCSVKYDLKKIGIALKKQFKDIPLIGCTTAGEITPNGIKDDSITGFSISSDQFIAESFLINADALAPEQVATQCQQLKQRVDENAGEDFKSLLWLMGNSKINRFEPTLSLLATVYPDLPMVGGCPGAGDDLGAPCVYFDGVFYSGHGLITYISTSLPFELFKNDNFEEGPAKVVLTEVDEYSRKVLEIDGLPASEGYLRAFNIQKKELDMAFYASHPQAVKVAGDLYVRAVVPSYQEGDTTVIDGLQFFCVIEEGMVLNTVKYTDIVKSFEDKMMSLEQMNGQAQLVLGCDCLYRKFDYQRTSNVEVMSSMLQKYNVIAFHGYGEYLGQMIVNQTFTGVYFGSDH